MRSNGTSLLRMSVLRMSVLCMSVLRSQRHVSTRCETACHTERNINMQHLLVIFLLLEKLQSMHVQGLQRQYPILLPRPSPKPTWHPLIPLPCTHIHFEGLVWAANMCCAKGTSNLAQSASGAMSVRLRMTYIFSCCLGHWQACGYTGEDDAKKQSTCTAVRDYALQQPVG